MQYIGRFQKTIISPSAQKIIFFISLFPFVSFYPIGTDVQPIIHVCAFFLGSYIIFTNKVRKETILSILVLLMFSAYIKPKGDMDVTYFKLIAFYFGICLYFFYKIFDFKQLFSVFQAAIYIYFFWSILIILQPGFMFFIQNFLVRNVNSYDLTYRGISALSTEPGLFGGMMVSFYAILKWFFDSDVISKKQYYLNAAIIVSMVVMSKSGTGFIYLLFFFILMFIARLTLLQKIIVCFMTSGLLYILSFDNTITRDLSDGAYGRGFQIIYNLFFNFESIQNDSSVFYRIYAFVVGVLSLAKYPLGVGLGDVSSASISLVDEYEFLRNFYSNSTHGYRFVSSVGYYMTIFGFFFMLFFLMLFLRSNTSILNKIFSLLLLTFSYSFAFPLPWILLNLDKDNVRN